MARSPTNTGPATPISPMTRNTASATIAAAGAPPRARPRRASPPAPWRARCSPASRSAARWCRSARTGSTAPAGTGRRSTNNPFFCPDAETAPLWADYLDGVRKAGSSIGAVIEVVAEGVPAGWGAPIYGKLDADLAARLMTINAVKGVEIGAGFAAAALSGEENADEMRAGQRRQPLFLSNHAGGILGGISTGQPIVARFAVKPTSSILTPRRTVDRARQRHRDRHQGPPRPLRRHPRRAGGRGDDGLRAGRSFPAPSRAGGRVADGRTSAGVILFHPSADARSSCGS